MSNTINIFNTLPQGASDSEDEVHQDNNTQVQKNQTKKPQNRNQEEKGKRNQQDTRQQDKQQSSKQQDKKGQEPQQSKTGVQGELAKKEERDYHNHHKDFHKQQKDDLDRPHPNDRHSGSTGHAYGVKPKKGGAGKGNWGTETEQLESPQKGEQNKETETGKPKEEKEALTLQEYRQQQKKVQNEPQINEAKAKITSEQLMKEMGTATLLKSRQQQEINDRKAGKKKERLDVDHHAAINTEHATLLNFRTGFVEKEYKQRGTDEGDFKKYGPRTGGKKREEKGEENQKAQAGTEEQVDENLKTQKENIGEGEENQEGKIGQGSHEGRGGYRGRRGGYRSNRGYGGYYNEHRDHGDRTEGRFEGDEQGEQGTSTGYTYKGAYRGNRDYRGNQGKYRPRNDREGRSSYGAEQDEHRGGQQYQPKRNQEERGAYGGSRGGYNKQADKPAFKISDEAFPKLG